MDEGGWLPVTHSDVIKYCNILVKRSCLRASCLWGTVVMSFQSYFCALIIHLSVCIYTLSLQAWKLALDVLVCAWFCLWALRYGSSNELFYEDMGHGWKSPEGYECLGNNPTSPTTCARKSDCSVNRALYFSTNKSSYLYSKKSKSKNVFLQSNPLDS